MISEKQNPARAHRNASDGVFSFVLQENLGHATASFTLDVYGHVSDKMKQDSSKVG